MFREDFEFHDEAGASHHGGKASLRDLDQGGAAPRPPKAVSPRGISEPKKPETVTSSIEVIWLPAAEQELKKIPFFVRGKARRNTEAFAAEKGVAEISIDTLYEAKAHYAR
jgi:light-independent protochlorophyllide reductase subunit B